MVLPAHLSTFIQTAAGAAGAPGAPGGLGGPGGPGGSGGAAGSTTVINNHHHFNLKVDGRGQSPEQLSEMIESAIVPALKRAMRLGSLP
jgi:hypothetical protein